MLNHLCAEILGVENEFFISKIESTTENRKEIIINSLLSDDEKLINKGIKIFNLIQ